jgi:hypothetical protein
MAKRVSTKGTIELKKLHRLADGESVEGQARCLHAVTALGAGVGDPLIAGDTSFRVAGDMLSLSQGTSSVGIPITSIDAVSLESVFEGGDPLRARVLLDITEGTTARRISLGSSAATWPHDYGMLVTALARQGVPRFNVESSGVSHDISGRLRFGPANGRLVLMFEPGATFLPVSGVASWFLPWYQKERSPRVIKKYSDDWLSRRDMQKDIRNAARFGWVPSQTQNTPGHVNVGTLVLLVVTLPTIIIPLFCVGHLRSRGGFMVAFDRRPEAPVAPAAHSTQVSLPRTDPEEALRKLARMKDEGLISPSDYQQAKDRILTDFAR